MPKGPQCPLSGLEDRLTRVWERRREHSGNSLIELLVAMALLAIIFVLFFQVLIPGLQIWTRSRAVADLEQQALVAEEKIVAAMLATTSRSISRYNSSGVKAVALLSHEGGATAAGFDTTTGRTRWSSTTLFVLRSDKVLRQTAWKGRSPTLTGREFPTSIAFALTSSEISSVLTSSRTPQGSRLSSNVELFALTAPGESRPDGRNHPAGQESYLVTLELAVSSYGREKRLRREIAVVPRIRERV